MQIIPVHSLSEIDFSDLGVHYSFTNPTGFHRGQHFYDKVLFPASGNRPVGYSAYIAEVPEDDEIVINAVDRNTASPESILPLDGDIICYAAPASHVVYPDLMQAFLVPKGTMVVLRAGVWHRDAYSGGTTPVHVLIGAEQLTYSSGDVEHVELPFGDWVKIDAGVRFDDTLDLL